jgi:hypothetical protein
MARSAVSLEVIDIAKPCPADWDEMRGDERVRFCRHCSLNVYNLSAMSRGDAEQLVRESEGRVCVRFYRRLDGTVVTTDCGGGWRLAAKRAGRFAKAASAMVIAAALAPLGFSRTSSASSSAKSNASPLIVTPPPMPAQRMGEMALMGDIAIPPAPQPPAPILGRIRVIAPVPLMGSPVPLPAPPPATQPAAQPATQPATQPAK